MLYFECTFFCSADHSSERTEYLSTAGLSGHTFFAATAAAHNMCEDGWEQKSIVRLHERDMSHVIRRRFMLAPMSQESVEHNKEPMGAVAGHAASLPVVLHKNRYESHISPDTYSERCSK